MATSNFSPTPRRSNLRNTLYEREYGVIPESSPAVNYQSPYLTNLNSDGGLAAAAASGTVTSTDPALDYKRLYEQSQNELKKYADQPETTYRSGPSEKVANYTALGGLGLGALSYLENRKTAKLQRESMRQDLATAREHNQRRRDNLASFNSGW